MQAENISLGFTHDPSLIFSSSRRSFLSIQDFPDETSLDFRDETSLDFPDETPFDFCHETSLDFTRAFLTSHQLGAKPQPTCH